MTEEEEKVAESERVKKLLEEAAEQYKEAQEKAKLLPYESGFIGKQ